MNGIDTGHREGCAFGRTARCTCTYLIQWDKTPEYTAPTFALTGEPASTQVTLEDADGNPVSATLTMTPVPTFKARNMFGQRACFDHDKVGWHTEAISCQEWDAMPGDKKPALTSEGPGFTLPAPLAAYIPNPSMTQAEAESLFKHPGTLTPLAQELADEKLRAKYWHGEYKTARRRFWIMFACATVSWSSTITYGLGWF